MRNAVLSLGAAALALAVAACGGTSQQENNVVTEDVTTVANLEELPPAETASNAVIETPAAEEKTPAANPAPEKPAPVKSAPAEPKPAEPKAAEPKAPDPSCLPEHRAAGHC